MFWCGLNKHLLYLCWFILQIEPILILSMLKVFIWSYWNNIINIELQDAFSCKNNSILVSYFKEYIEVVIPFLFVSRYILGQQTSCANSTITHVLHTCRKMGWCSDKINGFQWIFFTFSISMSLASPGAGS